ncbi:MAG: SpaH/EbpB family LPXTG-anchored major pilin [Arcanobacterium sp.]|nr:SpaH/EbpB family LPXTG-anchored major pilin [Arcanobacterium sp.]
MSVHKKRLIALTGVFALLASVATMDTTFAVDGDTTQGPSVSLINDDAKTSLTIHKYSGPANTTAECTKHDGQPVAESCLAGLERLAGAEFKVYKVHDLKSNADWEAARKLIEAGAAAYTPAGDPVATVETSATAGVKVANLNVALYYVVESRTPANYTGSQPFFVTLPMTTPNNQGWDYDLDVYPKNDKVNEPHKEVIDAQSHKVGDTNTYKVRVDLPNYGDVVGAPNTAGKYTAPDGVINHHDLPYFVVDDTFDPSFTNVQVTEVSIAGTPLEPADFTVSNINGNTNAKRVSLTESGLTKAAQSSGAEIVVTYTAEIASVPANGELTNTAVTKPGPRPNVDSTKPNPDDDPGNETPSVVSKFGKIRIEKVNAADKNVKLAGATFAVYPAKITFAADGKTIESQTCEGLTGNPLSTFTTNDEGKGVSEALEVTNWYNDGVELAEGGNTNGHLDGAQYAQKYGKHKYCLVETVAPAGFQLLADPIEFELETVGDSADVVYTFTEVVNQPDNFGNKLPFTGGEGVAIISIAGVLLIGAGTGYYFYTQRRRKDA